MGTEILNANAQLFNIFTLKNRSASRARRGSGIFGVLKLSLEEDLL